MTYNLKHSGKTQEFSTGAHRDSQEGKWRLDLIDPAFELAVAAVMEKGLKVHGKDNWRKGLPYSCLHASMKRHLMAWWLGKDDEDHLAHLACNIMFAINYRERVLVSDLDDRPGPLACASFKKNLEAPLTSAKKPPILVCPYCGNYLDTAATRCQICGKETDRA